MENKEHKQNKKSSQEQNLDNKIRIIPVKGDK